MSSRYSFSRLLAASALALAATQVQANDCEVAVILGEKPAIDAYADYGDFLVAIMDYKTRERAEAYQRENCPEVLAAAYEEPPVDDPTVTVGPETLDSAVARSRRLPRFDYATQRKWYDRTTSRTFELPRMEQSQLASETVETRLSTLDQGTRPARLQQLILNLQGPVEGIKDGEESSRQADDQFVYAQSAREFSVTEAFRLASQYHPFVYVLVSDDGRLIMYFDREYDLARVSSRIETCLGSC